MNTLQIKKIPSVLNNFPRDPDKVHKGASGSFQVSWMKDPHMFVVLYCQDEFPESVNILAGHHNGHSCKRLIDLALAGDAEGAMRQFDFILQCGGIGADRDRVATIVKEEQSSTKTEQLK